MGILKIIWAVVGFILKLKFSLWPNLVHLIIPFQKDKEKLDAQSAEYHLPCELSVRKIRPYNSQTNVSDHKPETRLSTTKFFLYVKELIQIST